MANGNDELILLELKEIKSDGKDTLKQVTENAKAIIRVEGCIETQNVKFGHNTDNITENKKQLGRVRDSVRNQLLKVAGMGGGIGAIAGYLSSLLG